MTKRISRLYPSVWAWENLLRAWHGARRGKRGHPPAARFEWQAAEHLLALQAELQAHSYRPGGYVTFAIHEPKRRLISAAPFRDRVVHHALCNVIEPIFERRFIHDSYANRRGKGTHAAIERCQEFARAYSNVLTCDVKQFFPAIDHAVLLESIGRVIVDSETLWLCATILESGRGILDDAYEMVYFRDDDLFAANRPRGLPIGNLTSQFWANVLLNRLDHFVKRELKCAAYLRYVDDFLLFGDDKRQLWAWRSAIIEYLATLRLTLHEERCQARPTSEGIPFLGFVVYPHYRLLKRRKGIAYRRKLRVLLRDYRQGRAPLVKVTASVQGWVNHARLGDTYGLRRRLFAEHPIEPPPPKAPNRKERA